MSIFSGLGKAVSEPNDSFVGKTLDFIDQNKESINNVIDLGDKVGLWSTDDVHTTADQVQSDLQSAYLKKTVNDYKPFLIGGGVLVGVFVLIKILK